MNNKNFKKQTIILLTLLSLLLMMLIGCENKNNATKTNSNANSVIQQTNPQEGKDDIFVEPEQTKEEDSKQNDVSLTYIGNKSTHKFHKSTCGEINKMSEKNKVALSNRDEAINEGYIPCQKCNP